MKIVILDGGTSNPGDISWEPITSLGDARVYDSTPPELIVERAADAEVLIINRIPITAETIDALPKLKFIGLLAIGYNNVDISHAREKGIDVCNVPFYCVETVAQQAFTLLLTLCGHVAEYTQTVKAGRWQEAVAMNTGAYPLYELTGKKLGIVGYGNIGRKVAELGLVLGMEVLINSRTVKDAPAGCRWVDMDTLFRESDAISLHCPLSAETKHLVNAERLAMMKPTALLVNTSRGGVIDSTALADALNSGRIAGAAIDVMESEPPEAGDPLLTAKNCCITPHIAWAAKESRQRLIATVASNISAFAAGKPQNVVN